MWDKKYGTKQFLLPRQSLLLAKTNSLKNPEWNDLLWNEVDFVSGLFDFVKNTEY